MKRQGKLEKSMRISEMVGSFRFVLSIVREIRDVKVEEPRRSQVCRKVVPCRPSESIHPSKQAYFGSFDVD